MNMLIPIVLFIYYLVVLILPCMFKYVYDMTFRKVRKVNNVVFGLKSYVQISKTRIFV